MFSTILKIMPFAASIAVAQSNKLEARQASAYAYGQSSDNYQGCFSSRGGGVTSQGSDIYQTSYECAKPCYSAGQPVVAVSESYCYCADLLPSLDTQVDDSMCSSTCNGIGSEYCGGPGYYSVYINDVLGGVLPARVPSSSGDDGDDEQPSSTPVSTKTVPRTTQSPTGTPKPRPHRHTDKHRPPPNHQVPKTTTSSTTVYKPVPTVSSPTGSAAQGSSTSSPSQSSSSSSTGKIVGIVVGVIGGIAVFAGLIAGAIFYVRRRRRMKNAENGHRRADSLNAFVASGAHMPGSLAGRMQTPSIAINDTRLDPWVMKETRRESGGSFLADSQDYSRRILKVTNPDSS